MEINSHRLVDGYAPRLVTGRSWYYFSAPLRAASAALALTLTSCAGKVEIQPLFPPATDLKDATERKPIASVEIVTDAQAAARYDVEVESWGERVSRAGGRICRWAVANGAALPFACPASPLPGVSE